MALVGHVELIGRYLEERDAESEGWLTTATQFFHPHPRNLLILLALLLVVHGTAERAHAIDDVENHEPEHKKSTRPARSVSLELIDLGAPGRCTSLTVRSRTWRKHLILAR